MRERKCNNQRGESLIETLAAMLIISLGMLLLAGAIVTAARVNDKAANDIIQVAPPLSPASGEPDTGWSLDAEGRQASDEWFVAVRENPEDASKDNDNQLPITLYKDESEGGGENVLYYYMAS